MIAEKASDLLTLARETLGADLLLPHFVSILSGLATEQTANQKIKIASLEYFNLLIEESEMLATEDGDA